MAPAVICIKGLLGWIDSPSLRVEIVLAGFDDRADTTATARGSGLWKAAQGVLSILTKLSTKWEDGELLARKFEVASAAVIEYVHGSETETTPNFSHDITDLGNCSSLASVLARCGAVSREHGMYNLT